MLQRKSVTISQFDDNFLNVSRYVWTYDCHSIYTSLLNPVTPYLNKKTNEQVHCKCICFIPYFIEHAKARALKELITSATFEQLGSTVPFRSLKHERHAKNMRRMWCAFTEKIWIWVRTGSTAVVKGLLLDFCTYIVLSYRIKKEKLIFHNLNGNWYK